MSPPWAATFFADGQDTTIGRIRGFVKVDWLFSTRRICSKELQPCCLENRYATEVFNFWKLKIVSHSISHRIHVQYILANNLVDFNGVNIYIYIYIIDFQTPFQWIRHGYMLPSSEKVDHLHDGSSSEVNQLRLVVYPIIYKVLYIQTVLLSNYLVHSGFN